MTHHAFRYDREKDGYITVYLDGEFFLGTRSFETVEHHIERYVTRTGGTWSLINNAS